MKCGGFQTSGRIIATKRRGGAVFGNASPPAQATISRGKSQPLQEYAGANPPHAGALCS